MAVIHTLAGFAAGGVSGVQAAQRDWSPYVVHFTQWAAMAQLRAAISSCQPPGWIASELKRADRQSLSVVGQIHNSGRLIARSPSAKNEIPACVCFSECNLPGLISHSERFGRFGFVFEKEAVLALHGGPCLYVSDAEYAELVKAFKAAPPGPGLNLYGRANVYRPAGSGLLQDYTHEREWRVFQDINLGLTTPVCLLAPMAHVPAVQALFSPIPIVPIDALFEWGA
jgi:hypothetical protein